MYRVVVVYSDGWVGDPVIEGTKDECRRILDSIQNVLHTESWAVYHRTPDRLALEDPCITYRVVEGSRP